MSTKEEIQKMRKNNMRIFPTYKKLAWDYLFFYTIDFLFLTQIKGISAADVVLKSTFYSIFNILLQIPANIFVEFLGRKNSLIFANIMNCFYMLVIMLSRNLGDLIFAEFISAIAFSIKNIAEPSLLNESIPPSKYKGQIFSRISAKGASGYYLLNAVSKIVAGFLFAINGYLPIVCSLVVLMIVSVLSCMFIEPVKRKKSKSNDIFTQKELKDIKDGFTYILKSERLKALIIAAALIVTLLAIAMNYHVSLLEELNISSILIGIIAAAGSFISSFASKKQEIFHKKLRNKSLFTIAFLLSISCIIAGICGIIAEKCIIFIGIIILTNLIFNFCYGMYYTIIDKYFRNFTNAKIDTKIFATKNLFSNAVRAIGGLFAAFLLDRMTTAYCMIVIGVIFTVVYVLMEKYMKTRVGLKPEEYSKEETKYDEQKQIQGEV